MKGCITISLFTVISGLDDGTGDQRFVFSWYSPFEILGVFLLVIGGSLAVGYLSACIVSMAFASFKPLRNGGGTY